MIENDPEKKLINRLPAVEGKYLTDVPLKKHTWFGVGGPAEIMFLPKDAADLCTFLRNKPADVPVFIVGGGSNLLVRDGGIAGVVIKLDTPYFKQCAVEGKNLTCFAGMRNMQLQKILLENNIGGLEFLCSVPGTPGGLVRTNAGCFGKSLSDVLIAAEIVDGTGNRRKISPDELNLSYRHSSFPADWIIVSVTLRGTDTPSAEIRKILDEQKAYRLKNQPCNARTAGSTFKNPEGMRAWELIKRSGCADLAVGGAKVSDKHCNFLINTGTATAEDIENLGDLIVETVKKETAVTLEWEVKKVGERK